MNTLPPPEKKEFDLKNQYALLVGINYTGQKGELKGCCNDVKSIKTILTDSLKVPPSNIHTLIDDDDGVFMPTKQNILDGLQWLVRMSRKTPDCRVFLHYSGHGTYVSDWKSYSRDEKDGYDEALVPKDAETNGLIVDDELKLKFVCALPRECSLFCLVDACHSGSSLDMCYRWDETSGSVCENFRPAFCKALMISGCRDDQTSADAYNRETRTNEGAMTSAFCHAVKTNGLESNAIEFVRTMHDKLREGGFVQKPQLSSSRPISTDVPLFTSP